MKKKFNKGLMEVIADSTNKTVTYTKSLLKTL